MSRTVREGEQSQGPNERIGYRLTCTPSPASVLQLTVVDLASGADVTATCMPGSATLQGAVITLPLLYGLTLNHRYQVKVRYSDGINQLEPYFLVRCV